MYRVYCICIEILKKYKNKTQKASLKQLLDQCPSTSGIYQALIQDAVKELSEQTHQVSVYRTKETLCKRKKVIWQHLVPSVHFYTISFNSSGQPMPWVLQSKELALKKLKVSLFFLSSLSSSAKSRRRFLSQSSFKRLIGTFDMLDVLPRQLLPVA